LSYRLFSCCLLLVSIAGCTSPTTQAESVYKLKLSPAFAKKLAASQKVDFLKDIPKIDTHEHYRAGGNLEAYLNVMSQFGVQKVVLLPTGIGPDNRGYKRHMKALLAIARKHPDIIIPYATVDEVDPEAPRVLEDAVKNGARGLKLMAGHPNFYDEPLDSPKMMALFEKVKTLKIPVLIHISPVRIPKQLQEFENLVRAFPEVTIVAAHYGRTAPEFKEGARLLDAYPNLYMDVSMGGGLPRYQKEMQLDLKKYRDFIFKYQDRLMWGSDMIITKGTTKEFIVGRMSIDFLILGKPFYVDTREGYDGERVLLGLDLPRPVLEKIFYRNPKRILRLE